MSSPEPYLVVEVVSKPESEDGPPVSASRGVALPPEWLPSSVPQSAAVHAVSPGDLPLHVVEDTSSWLDGAIDCGPSI